MKANKTNLSVFLLLSIGLHVLLIAAWQSDNDSKVSVQEASSPIAMQLLTTTSQSAATNKTSPVKTLHRPVSNTQSVTKKSSPRKKSTSSAKNPLTRPGRQPVTTRAPVDNRPVEPATMPAAQQASNNTAPLPATYEQQRQLGARIQKQLRVKIAFNRHYPGMAIRNAWEGQVKLGIRVQANGNLTNIHVINSSGYNILDRAAVNSVRHVAALPEARSWLQGQSIDVILPVIYKLTDS